MSEGPLYTSVNFGAGEPGLINVVRLKKDIFIDNLLVRVHMIIEMILVNRPCATEV